MFVETGCAGVLWNAGKTQEPESYRNVTVHAFGSQGQGKGKA
jgi:hypothetical protein